MYGFGDKGRKPLSNAGLIYAYNEMHCFEPKIGIPFTSALRSIHIIPPYRTHPHPHNYELPSKGNNIDKSILFHRVLHKDCFSCFLARQLLHIVFNSGVSVDYFNKDYHRFIFCMFCVLEFEAKI